MVRRLKKDVLKELPPKLRQIVYLDDGKQIKDPAIERWNRLFGADMAKAEAMMEAAKTEEDFKEAIKRMDAVVGIAFEEMSKFRHQTALQKLPMAIEYIENYLAQTESKVIVFAHHKDVLGAIFSHFKDKAIGIWGDGASDKERQEKVHIFQENPEIRLFVGGLKAAGVGITLTAASTVIFVEGDWTPAAMMQAEDRAHRIGQASPVHIIQLVLRDSLDANMAKYVLRKMKLIERTLDQKLKVENAVA
jgi:SWI/SNF-related matrix-associated actin-dependent regulator 1 of chromatin subfamily A